jgi:hypothetical protein
MKSLSRVKVHIAAISAVLLVTATTAVSQNYTAKWFWRSNKAVTYRQDAIYPQAAVSAYYTYNNGLAGPNISHGDAKDAMATHDGDANWERF